MKLEPTLDIIPSLLFPFDINSDQDETVEDLIAKTDINNDDDDELTHLFNTLIKPDFTKRIVSEQQWYIDTLTFFLNKNEKFNRVFSEITTYFSDEPIDKRHFMSVLLECLKKYKTS